MPNPPKSPDEIDAYSLSQAPPGEVDPESLAEDPPDEIGAVPIDSVLADIRQAMAGGPLVETDESEHPALHLEEPELVTELVIDEETGFMTAEELMAFVNLEKLSLSIEAFDYFFRSIRGSAIEFPSVRRLFLPNVELLDLVRFVELFPNLVFLRAKEFDGLGSPSEPLGFLEDLLDLETLELSLSAEGAPAFLRPLGRLTALARVMLDFGEHPVFDPNVLPKLPQVQSLALRSAHILDPPDFFEALKSRLILQSRDLPSGKPDERSRVNHIWLDKCRFGFTQLAWADLDAETQTHFLEAFCEAFPHASLVVDNRYYPGGQYDEIEEIIEFEEPEEVQQTEEEISYFEPDDYDEYSFDNLLKCWRNDVHPSDADSIEEDGSLIPHEDDFEEKLLEEESTSFEKLMGLIQNHDLALARQGVEMLLVLPDLGKGITNLELYLPLRDLREVVPHLPHLTRLTLSGDFEKEDAEVLLECRSLRSLFLRAKVTVDVFPFWIEWLGREDTPDELLPHLTELVLSEPAEPIEPSHLVKVFPKLRDFSVIDSSLKIPIDDSPLAPFVDWADLRAFKLAITSSYNDPDDLGDPNLIEFLLSPLAHCPVLERLILGTGPKSFQLSMLPELPKVRRLRIQGVQFHDLGAIVPILQSKLTIQPDARHPDWFDDSKFVQAIWFQECLFPSERGQVTWDALSGNDRARFLEAFSLAFPKAAFMVDTYSGLIFHYPSLEEEGVRPLDPSNYDSFLRDQIDRAFKTGVHPLLAYVGVGHE